MDLQKAGALIRKLRLEKQMTQRQLAEKNGCCAQNDFKMGMRAGLSGCVASARFIRRARHGYDQPPQRTAKREGKRRRQYEKNSILHLPGVRQHFDRDGRRGNRLLRQKAWRHEGAGMRRNARASCRGDGRRMVCDVESPDDKSAFHPLYRVLLVRLYPEQNAEVRMPKMPHATWYIGCSEDDLYTCRLK